MYKKHLIYQKNINEPFCNTIYNNILKELDKNRLNLSQKRDLASKKYIKFNIIYLNIKIISLKSNNFFIKKINSIFKDKRYYYALKAFFYLKNNFLYQTKRELYEFYILNALFYELLFDISSSLKYYETLLKIDNSKHTKELYSNFLSRNIDKIKNYNNLDSINNIESIEQLHSTFTFLSNLYEHYKSCNRLDISYSYYLKAIDVLEVLYNKNSTKYRYLCLQHNIIPTIRVVDANYIISKIDNLQVKNFFYNQLKPLKSKKIKICKELDKITTF